MSRWPKRPRANHPAAAAGLREMPGVELLVGTYPAPYSAASAAREVRTGQRGYAPAGAFEARTAPVGDETGLYVRYIGQPSEGVAS